MGDLRARRGLTAFGGVIGAAASLRLIGDDRLGEGASILTDLWRVGGNAGVLGCAPWGFVRNDTLHWN